jgi:hypothetical protein
VKEFFFSEISILEELATLAFDSSILTTSSEVLIWIWDGTCSDSNVVNLGTTILTLISEEVILDWIALGW